MKYEIVTHNVPKNFIVIDNKEFSCSEFISVLEELRSADGAYSTACIYNDELADILVKYNVARLTSRGYIKSDEFHDIADIFGV